MATRKLQIVFQGDASKFKATADEVDGRLSGMAKVAGAAALGLGVGAVAGAGVAVTQFADFDSKMREVFTLMPGISGEAMGTMTGQVKDFSREFGVLPTEVVPALYQSISAGVPPDNIFTFLETAQKAAKGGVTELETAVDGISSVVNAYGSDVIDAAKASDLMFTTVKLGKTDFGQLSASLSQVTPIASSLGVGFEDVSAALAALTAKGVPTAQATTQVRSALAELGKEGTIADKAFRELSGQSFQDFIAAGGDLNGALDLMRKGADESGKSLLDMFGSVEAGQAALALQGNEQFIAALNEMGNSAGATEAAFETMSGGLSDNFAKIKANLAVLLLEIGERLAPALVAISDWIVQKGLPAIARLGEIFDQDVRPKIEAFIEFARPKVEEFVTFAGEQFAKFQGYYENDIKPALDNIVAGIEWVVEQVREYWPEIEQIVKPVIEQVQNVVTTAFEVITGVFDIFIQLLKGDFTGAWNAAKDLVGEVMEFFKESIRNTWEIIKGFIELFKELGNDIIRGMWDGFLDAWPAVKEWVEGLPGQVVKGIGNVGRLLWDKGKEIIQSLIDGMWSLKDKIPNPVDWIPGKGVLNRIPGVNLGGDKAPIEDFYRDMSGESTAVAQSQHFSQQPKVNVTVQGPGLSAMAHELDIYASGQLR